MEIEYQFRFNFDIDLQAKLVGRAKEFRREYEGTNGQVLDLSNDVLFDVDIAKFGVGEFACLLVAFLAFTLHANDGGRRRSNIGGGGGGGASGFIRGSGSGSSLKPRS